MTSPPHTPRQLSRRSSTPGAPKRGEPSLLDELEADRKRDASVLLLHKFDGLIAKKIVKLAFVYRLVQPNPPLPPLPCRLLLR